MMESPLSATAPTIVINTPGVASNNPAPQLQSSQDPNINVRKDNPSPERPYDPQIDTIVRNIRPNANRISTSDFRSPDSSCYLCDEQNPGDFAPTTKFLENCLLCSRSFCPLHKSSSWHQVCNINHSKHYHECMDLVKNQSQGRRRNSEVEELLVQQGIFPSMGEREKAIFATSPVTPSTQQQLEHLRSLDTAVTDGDDHNKVGILEEKDVVGADIAV